jgi:hypothetical protein
MLYLLSLTWAAARCAGWTFPYSHFQKPRSSSTISLIFIGRWTYHLSNRHRKSNWYSFERIILQGACAGESQRLLTMENKSNRHNKACWKSTYKSMRRYRFIIDFFFISSRLRHSTAYQYARDKQTLLVESGVWNHNTRPLAKIIL